MKSLLIILIAAAFNSIFLINLRAQDALQSKWHNSETFKFPDSFNYDTENELFYLLTNDNDNLYIHLIMVSDASQNKALRFGLTVFIDPELKKSRKNYIKFISPEVPFQSRPQTDLNEDERQKARLKLREQLASGIYEAEIAGFGVKKPIITSIKDLNGINCEIYVDEQVKLHYNITIPLSKISAKNRAAENFSFGVESGTFDPEKMAMARQRAMSQRGEHSYAARERAEGFRQGGEGRPSPSRNPAEMEKRRLEMQKITIPMKVWINNVSVASDKNE